MENSLFLLGALTEVQTKPPRIILFCKLALSRSLTSLSLQLPSSPAGRGLPACLACLPAESKAKLLFALESKENPVQLAGGVLCPCSRQPRKSPGPASRCSPQRSTSETPKFPRPRDLDQDPKLGRHDFAIAPGFVDSETS